MITRSLYLNQLKPFIDKKIIKILAGVRRSGKSTILEMLEDYLLRNGVNNDHIIFINYSYNLQDQYSKENMLIELKEFIKDDERYYLMLDEIQEIDGWEKVINVLFENYNVDIYITGSNSRLMSNEISTYLSGRYITIPVYTLSFEEYLTFNENSPLSKEELFNKYLQQGGFPLIANSNFTNYQSYEMIKDIYNSIVLNDIIRRYKITNIDLFTRVVNFVMENLGKTFSANSIINFLKSEKRNISVELIYDYLTYLEKAFVIYRAKRYDLQGKTVLKTQEKFYLSDHSFKYSLFGFSPTSISSTLENIVFFELKRRNYDVYIGKLYNKEIDFVAINRDDKMYIQVCRNLPDSSNREVTNLIDIKDQFPKIIITLEKYAPFNIEGIKIVNIIDFLQNYY